MHSDKPKVDVLIIGGGPAGLSTALHLNQLAPHLTDRILLLEKAHYPRLKLCAGGLVADAEVILEGLGLDVSEVPHVDASVANFDFAGKGLKIQLGRRKTLRNADKKSAPVSLPQPPAAHILRVIRRDEFDAWLAGKAESRGIQIRQGVTVKDVRPDDDGVTVITDQGEFRAQVVVGADGSNGVARRCVLPDAPVHTARVLEVLTPVPTRPGPHRPDGHLPQIRRTSVAFGGGREGAAFFDFFPVPAGIAGYVWDFPTQVDGQPMRCWGVYDTNLLAHKGRPPLKQPLAEEMARHGFDLSQHELKGHPIRWYSPRYPVSVPRVLLAGDAVGADGVFGEGISMALGYGKIAAGELAKAFSTGDFSFSGYKRRLVRSALGQTLFVRWAITQVLYRLHWAWFQKWFWRTGKPVILAFSWVFVLNWGKRLKT